MLERLPEFVDPLAMADKRRQFKGSLPIAQLPGLADLLFDEIGAVQMDLQFGKDGRMVTVTGSVQANFNLSCQCCLGAIPWQVDSTVNLAVVKSIDQANLLPESYEALLLEGDTVSLVDIAQEEVLLAVPAIPQHEVCAHPDKPETEPESGGEQRPNPFAILANLKSVSTN